MNVMQSLRLFCPEIAILLGAFLILFLDFFFNNKKILGWISIAVLIAAGVASWKLVGGNYPLFHGFFVDDGITQFFRYAFLGIVAVTILVSIGYPKFKDYEGEYYSLFLFMTFGLILMASSTNLLMMFLAIEFVSILSYLFTGYLKNDNASKEASLKYLLFGSIASGMMLFGMSFLFGASGSLNLDEIRSALTDPTLSSIALVGSILFLAGIAFKVSAAPFHFWAADVYEGAPTPVTAFLTVGSKAAGFAVFIRFFSAAYSWLGQEWVFLVSLIAMLTMTIGNLTAIQQKNIKRLLAYSSIAQAGYIMMGLAAVNQTGVSAVLVYLVAYAFTNLGAFTIVIAISNQLGSDQIEAYNGLGKRSPMLAVALTIFLLSLAGIPPLAGFIGKWLVFASVIEANLIALASVAAVNSAIAAFYYFRIVRAMYLVESENTDAISPSWVLGFSVILLLAGTVIFGVLPSPLVEAVNTTLAI